MPIQFIKLFTYVSFALLAFAGNSVLCRLALGQGLIDASSFTSLRLLSGVLTLIVISLVLNRGSGSVVIRQLTKQNTTKTWLASLMLFVYAATFSYAYISLDTGTGALILFGMVQLSMIMIGALYGNKLHYSEWLGILVAFAGVVYLVKPNLSTPSFLGFVLMALSGVAWAIYTLLGRGSKQPILDTSANFLRTIPFVVVLILFTVHDAQLTNWGIIYSILSGAVTSAVGYAIWYLVLKDLTVTQAAVLQLLVPILAALGGVLFVSEMISMRLVISSLLVLGGILMVIIGRRFLVRR
ncbi:DMT family transporter [Psychrosphaera sp. F3M07]|uniref:DMT family transporter n=1 Tax=Psychrosphaera sp. F3M07 TaxID=2841560 RepID=UPI001C07F263|nr:DMT family transporter [Psychrosphaera sp. F3M07]MBU2918224.1 DMT family transporter [Psychrosphaera sp. F3M07]